MNIIVPGVIVLYIAAVLLVVIPKNSVEIEGIKFYFSDLDARVLEQEVKAGLAGVASSILSDHVSNPRRVIIAESDYEYMLLALEWPWSPASFAKTYGALNTVVMAPWQAPDTPVLGRGPSERPFASILTHEMVHVSVNQWLGLIPAFRLRTWVIEGLAEYISKGSSYPIKPGLERICSDRPDTTASYEYLTYRVNAAAQLEVEGLSLEAFLDQHGDFGERFEVSKQVVCEEQGKWVQELETPARQVSKSGD